MLKCSPHTPEFNKTIKQIVKKIVQSMGMKFFKNGGWGVIWLHTMISKLGQDRAYSPVSVPESFIIAVKNYPKSEPKFLTPISSYWVG